MGELYEKNGARVSLIYLYRGMRDSSWRNADRTLSMTVSILWRTVQVSVNLESFSSKSENKKDIAITSEMGNWRLILSLSAHSYLQRWRIPCRTKQTSVLLLISSSIWKDGSDAKTILLVTEFIYVTNVICNLLYRPVYKLHLVTVMEFHSLISCCRHDIFVNFGN